MHSEECNTRYSTSTNTNQSIEYNPTTYVDPLMRQLVSFIAEPQFQTLFENFFLEYASEFEFSSSERSIDEQEHNLHYYELFIKFKELFESKLNEFCDKQHLSMQE